jgi:isovaleryl-CoA dehydrogenase
MSSIHPLNSSIQQSIKRTIENIAKPYNLDAGCPIWQPFAKQGLLGLCIEPCYGGIGKSITELASVMKTISAIEAGFALSYIAHAQLATYPLSQYGSKEQKNKWLPALATGQKIGALALTEPNVGSDALNMHCHIEKMGNQYKLNGRKQWITNSTEAGMMIVFASSNRSDKHNVFVLIVDTAKAGVIKKKPFQKSGMKSSHTGEVIFDDVMLDPSDIIGPPGKGLPILMHGLDIERVLLAAGPVGIMEFCIEQVIDYSHRRRQFGLQLKDMPIRQVNISEMLIRYETSKIYLQSALSDFEKQGFVTKTKAAILLEYASNACIEVAQMAMSCLGANAYAEVSKLGQALLDAKLYAIGGGTSDIRKLIIAKQTLKSEKIQWEFSL